MTGTRFLIRTLTALPMAIMALTGTSQSVWAQSGTASEAMLEEVIVTATRREMSLQDVPMAISAVGQDQIERLGITNMDDYFRSVPSLSLIDGGGYQKHMIIRGVAVGIRESGGDQGCHRHLCRRNPGIRATSPTSTRAFSIWNASRCSEAHKAHSMAADRSPVPSATSPTSRMRANSRPISPLDTWAQTTGTAGWLLLPRCDGQRSTRRQTLWPYGWSGFSP